MKLNFIFTLLKTILLLSLLLPSSFTYASGGYDNGTPAGKGNLDLDLTLNPGDVFTNVAGPKGVFNRGQSYLVWGYGLTDHLDFHGYVSHEASGINQIYYGLMYNFYSNNWLDLSTAVGLRHRLKEIDIFSPQLLYTVKLPEDFDVIGSFVNVYGSTKKQNLGISTDIALRVPVPELLTPSFANNIKIAIGMFRNASGVLTPTYSVDFSLSPKRLRYSKPTLYSFENPEYIDATNSRVRFSYESVNLPVNEKMGFLGSTVLFDVNKWLSVGGGGYGALVGQRGGFITLGGAAEVRQEIASFAEVSSGFFVGAGGGHGGLELAGGGLMFRYHAGAEIKSERWGNIGGGVSYIDFPLGTVHSIQPYISYNYQFSTLIGHGWLNEPESDTFGYSPLAEQEFAMLVRTHSVRKGVVQSDGVTPQHKTINLMQLEWNRFLNDDYFLHVEAGGPMGGQSQGYMQILFGGGYRHALLDTTWLKFITSAGVAGGGGVETGGGLLVDASMALQQKLGDHLYAEIATGYTFSPGNSFKSINYAVKIGSHFNVPDFKGRVAMDELDDFDFSHLRIRAAHQTYYKGSPNWRTRDQGLNIQLVGVQSDYIINDSLYLTGQIFSAYKGKAGAYIVGLVGAGVHIPVAGALYLEAEAMGGPAGGGSLAVGGGLVWQSNAGIGYQFNENYNFIAQYGYMAAATKGNFKAKVATFSLGYNFTLFTKN